jgi:hypothetical protein
LLVVKNEKLIMSWGQNILRFLAIGGVLDVKKVGRALSRTGELLSGVEKWISGFH